MCITKHESRRLRLCRRCIRFDTGLLQRRMIGMLHWRLSHRSLRRHHTQDFFLLTSCTFLGPRYRSVVLHWLSYAHRSLHWKTEVRRQETPRRCQEWRQRSSTKDQMSSDWACCGCWEAFYYYTIFIINMQISLLSGKP